MKKDKRKSYKRVSSKSENGDSFETYEDEDGLIHQFKDSTGRYYILVNGERFYADELVAQTFIPCPGDFEDYEVEHIDGDPGNNVAANLRWKKKDK